MFTHEGEPVAVNVTQKHVAVDYGASGVLFDAGNGRTVRRYTIVDGWPKVRPPAFGPAPGERAERTDPGVMIFPMPWEKDKPEMGVAASAELEGRTFRALQPYRFLHRLGDFGNCRREYGRWTPILHLLNDRCFVEAQGTRKPRRYTMEDGLPSNIVSHLVVGCGGLWAACGDIWDEGKNAWGPGGLCRFDPARDRWVRVERIAGRPVRWVTLLQPVGDELWVGFRAGSGVAGDKIVYGMFAIGGLYRPRATEIVLARLRGGKWQAWSRPPREDALWDFHTGKRIGTREYPTEAPRKLAVIGGRVLLYSTTQSSVSAGYWSVQLDGHLSGLDPLPGTWDFVDARKHLGEVRLLDLHSQRDRAVAVGEAGAFLWNAAGRSWRRLDPGCHLSGPQITAAAAVGDELWIGYTGTLDARTGLPGISRFHEQTGRWTHMHPEQLGTSQRVESIVPGPQGGAWVLFRERELTMGQRWYWPVRYLRTDVKQRSGLGRFADGKWTFPATPLEGVPPTIRQTWKEDGRAKHRDVPAAITHLARAGDALFVANDLGVFVAGRPWRKIVDGPVRAIGSAADGKALLIARYLHETDEHQRGFYDLGTGKVTFREARSGDPQVYWRSFLHDIGAMSGDRKWLRVPVRKDGQWYFGPLPGDLGTRVIAETPHAVWVVLAGQLVRIDRKAMPGWFGRSDG